MGVLLPVPVMMMMMMMISNSIYQRPRFGVGVLVS